ncbi:MAG: tetratricopeptide repeat protein [Elusimicrobia bacterium]|nr:tetratricopeptide repeat protein [Elusimicrobiota bacterium]
MNLLTVLMLCGAALRAQEPPPAGLAEPAVQVEEAKAPEAKVETEKPAEPKVEAEKPAEPMAEAPKKEEAKAEEPKPEEAKAPEPKVEKAKAPEPKADETKAEEPPRRTGPAAELAFLKAVLDDAAVEVTQGAVEEAFFLSSSQADAPEGQDARLLAAQLLRKKEDWKAAITAYLGFLYEHPEADAAFRARQEYRELVDKRLARKLKEGFMSLGQVPARYSRPERLSAMLRAVTDAAGDELYEPLLGEFERFRERYPSYPEGDKVQLALADLHAKKGEYKEALHALARLIAVYPQSGLKAQAQWGIASIYADHLKKYDRAVEFFQELTRRYPKTPMVLPSMQKTGELLEEKIRDYAAAAEIYGKIAHLFPRTEGAYKAMLSEARLQRDRLKAPADAVATFKRIAEDFAAPAAVEALTEAAVVARKALKDYGLEVELKKSLVNKFPDSAEAPEALFSVAEILEDDLKDDAKAKEAFQQFSSKYPTHKLAKKAAARVAAIDKRGGW